jgi:hypothetical protein
VTIVLPGIERLRAIPVTLGRGWSRTLGAGSKQVTMRFAAALRSAMRNAHSIKLEISGYAVHGTSPASAPRSARLTLTR